jgi:hypothetical protein
VIKPTTHDINHTQENKIMIENSKIYDVGNHQVGSLYNNKIYGVGTGQVGSLYNNKIYDVGNHQIGSFYPGS